MTNEVLSKTSDKFKQVYIPESRFAPYTSARIGLDDYTHTHIWQKLRKLRLVKDNFQCFKCKTAINVEVHHIHYPAVWGTESVDNDLITLCAECHAEIHSKDIEKEI